MAGAPLILPILVLGMLWPLAAQETVDKFTATVVLPNLAARVEPGRQHEAVALLAADTLLRVTARKGEWARIQAPEDAAAWVAADDVLDGQVVVRQTQGRAGPHEAHAAYFELDAGTPVKVVSRWRGEWLRVVPPPEASVWVRLDGLRRNDKAAPEPEEQAPEPPPEFVDAGDFPAASLRGILEANPDAADEERPYKLSVTVHEATRQLAWLRPGDAPLDKWVGKRVIVTGELRWVRAWQYPLILVHQVEAADGE